MPPIAHAAGLWALLSPHWALLTTPPPPATYGPPLPPTPPPLIGCRPPPSPFMVRYCRPPFSPLIGRCCPNPPLPPLRRHPDKNLGAEAEAASQFQRLSCAYARLTRPDTGQEYADLDLMQLLSEEMMAEAWRQGVPAFELLYM